MKLKVCGMKRNTTEVAALRPDYLGFIFWKPSSRYFEGEIPKLPDGIEKIGVFVDATLKEILGKKEKYNLQGIQLHGHESADFCKELKTRNRIKFGQNVIIIKVFSIKNNFDFSILKSYEEVCDYY
ncbi:MAG: phosphoribosylanthranilate isomerase, partial [Pricia sp.]